MRPAKVDLSAGNLPVSPRARDFLEEAYSLCKRKASCPFIATSCEAG